MKFVFISLIVLISQNSFAEENVFLNWTKEMSTPKEPEKKCEWITIYDQQAQQYKQFYICK